VFNLADTLKPMRPARLIRYALPNRKADAEVRARYLELLLRTEKTRADSDETVESERTRPAQPTLPAFQTLRVDSEGNLWVEHTRLSKYPERELDATEQQTWTVFDSGGVVIGDVTTPAGLAISQIGKDWILGVWKDDDGVEHVRLHRMKRN
jgi:hypothetical protein